MKELSLFILGASMLSFVTHADSVLVQKLNAGCFKKVYCIEAVLEGSGARIMFEALQNYPITVEFTGEVSNLKPSKPLPLSLQVKPGAKVEVFRVENWSAADKISSQSI